VVSLKSFPVNVKRLGCGDRLTKYMPITVAFVPSLVTRLQSAEKVLAVALWD
jgi:hypothetical protein